MKSDYTAPDVAYTDRYAEVAHRDQVDKAGRPYVEHVRAVAVRLRPYGDWAVMAGLLHDVVEDCDVTLGTFYDLGYPDDVIEAVEAVSAREGEHYDELIIRAAAHPLGCLVKLADNAENGDPMRLIALDLTTQARLEEKYHRARQVLLPALDGHRRRLRTAGRELFFGPAGLEGGRG